MGLPTIFFANPIRQVFFIFFYYFNGVIRTAAINDYIFQIGIILIQYGLYSFLQKKSLIIGGGYDANFWKFLHIFKTFNLRMSDSAFH